ncbi:class E sortase [Yinghuangia seranimata]|uniref:class E sortase n=1 Tax=Yinghuangia seranimata TaxID=408067 RepID=UPI00248B4BA7|nr:class E sortase [Yinghuangia seranimata]MDI2132852.1 class E sortase [Yinghuangia seranimata]
MRKIIRGTAEIVFTLGLVGLLLCVHQLWWTNIESRAKAEHNLEKLDDLWKRPPAAATLPDPTVTAPTQGQEPTEGPSNVGTDGQQDGSGVEGAGTVRGKAFAKVYIPRLGKDFVKPIVEGTSLDSLAQGVGHYTYAPYTAPGQVGNFGLAGHRNGHGEPFRYLNKLRVGDFVVVETATHWYTYQITRGPYITRPSDGAVLSTSPPELGGLPPGQKLITLTTCDPEFTSKNRMVYWGTLTVEDAKRPGFTPAALAK